MNRLLDLKASLINQTSFNGYRGKSTIDKLQFNRIVYGPNYQERLRGLKTLQSHPQVFIHHHLLQSTRAQQRQSSFRRLFAANKYVDIANLSSKNPNKLTLFGNAVTFYDLNLITIVGVHYSLYLKILERLGTSSVHKEYYENACKFKDIGCFALTQLMHGSNVRGIMTEAHYDHATRQFVINSPSRDAMKFWIGGSAKISNICALWAQLYIGGKNYGVHCFVVPIRCKKTHKVLPGITIGDVGPKFGLNGVDNGFILFDKFRIPAANILDKVSGVNEKGQFFSTVKGEGKRFGMTLAALSQGRLFMCCHSTSLGLSALAIAIRYTFVRRQFGKKGSQSESLLIDYPLTERRMIPLLAQQIIYMCATMKTFEQSQNNPQKNVLNPQNPLIQQIHAISSVLKVKTGWTSTEAIRECRQMMGGHGYSAYSKMGALYSNNDVNNTWQGQNHVLIQQTTKYVLDNYQRAMAGKQIRSPLLKFFSDAPSQQFSSESSFLLSFDLISDYLKTNIARKVQQLGGNMLEMQSKQMNQMDIWNNAQVYQGQQVALITGDLFVLQSCLIKMKQIKDPKTRQVFQNVLHLWSLVMLRNDEFVSEDNHGQIQKFIMQYCEKLKPQLLGLLQSITASQQVIGSPFANQSGLGMQKYMDLVLSQPRKERAQYWQTITKR